jgi:hypothetical protein
MNTGEGGIDLNPSSGAPGWLELGRTYLKIGAIGFLGELFLTGEARQITPEYFSAGRWPCHAEE